MTTATKVHAIHEAGHSLAAHACGMVIRSVRIDVATQSGTDVDRGYDAVAAEAELRGNASSERIRELLPHMKRDLTVTLAGMSAEELHGVYTTGDPENRRDEQSAAQLADNVSLGQWKNLDPLTRPRFSDREKPQAFSARAKSLSDQLVKKYSKAVEALAERLEAAMNISGEEAHRILEENGAKRGSVADDQLP